MLLQGARQIGKTWAVERFGKEQYKYFVKFDLDRSPEVIDAFRISKEPARIKEYQAEIIYDYSIIPGMAIRIADGANIHVAMAYFKKVEGVVSVEHDQIIRLTDPVKPRLEVM